MFGELEYKTTRFEHRKLNTDNFQGVAIMNYTDENIPHTRCIEHKHFENIESPVTWITWEYPQEYKAETTEPYYPVNDKKNNDKYQQYKTLADSDPKVKFGGRLAEYKYYDMYQVIESALNFIKNQK
jgi:UDP-galactopyranose mutase